MTIAGAAGPVDDGEISRCERHAGVSQSLVEREGIAKMACGTAECSRLVRSYETSHPLVACEASFTLPANHRHGLREQRRIRGDVGSDGDEVRLIGPDCSRRLQPPSVAAKSNAHGRQNHVGKRSGRHYPPEPNTLLRRAHW